MNTFKRGVLSYGLVTGFVAVILATGAAQPGQGATRPPNIVFVLADQWRFEAFGYAGNPDIKTPNLDRLQREGIRFVNAVAAMPGCPPMRASLLTGQRPFTPGVFVNTVPPNPKGLPMGKF